MLSRFSPVPLFMTPRTVPVGLLCPRDSPGKNTGVGFHSLLQGIFPTEESNPHLLSPALAGGFFTTSATWEVAFNWHLSTVWNVIVINYRMQ